MEYRIQVIGQMYFDCEPDELDDRIEDNIEEMSCYGIDISEVLEKEELE